MRFILLFILLSSCIIGCKKTVTTKQKPNILFILMDDLGYGQFGIYNDTITTNDFNPFFVHLVDSLQGYSKEKALEFSKTAIPTLTRLAKDGILFTNAHTSSNLCATSRMGIATGKLQAKVGMYTNGDVEKGGLAAGSHLAEKLQEQNYKTAHIGKWHIGSRDRQLIPKILKKYNVPPKTGQKELKALFPEAHKAIKECGYLGSVIENHNPRNNGFDYFYGYNRYASEYYNSTLVWENFKYAGKQKGYNTDVFTDKAMNFMKDQIDEENPFYLQLHYHAVHDSIEPKAPDAYFNKFDSDSYTLNNFYAHIYGVDSNVKRIVEFLKSNGQYENTLIVFTSDNGAMCAGSYNGHKTGSPLPGNAPFSGHKGNYYQGGMRIPMFMHWPNEIKEPSISEELVSTMDILPSAIDVAGGTIPENIDGKSLVPMFREPDLKIHDHLVWAGLQSNKWGYLIQNTTKTHSDEDKFAPPAWAIRKGVYLLRFTGVRESGVYLDCMQGREAMVELFNIKKDPSELRNLAKQFPRRVNELAKLYFSESKDFIAPVSWKKAKWDELVQSRELFDF